MKIGIMGTHGTGKSTFAKEMADKARRRIVWDVEVVTGIARSCPFPINQHTTETAQRWIYHRHMLAELEWCSRVDLVICDRTVLDSLVYAEVAGLDKVVDDYLPAALRWMETYDDIYWLRPVSGRLVDDGQRDTDPAYQERVDRTFRIWVDRYGIKATMVNGIESKE